MIAEREKTNNNSKAGTYNQLEQQRQIEYTPRYVILVNDMLKSEGYNSSYSSLT
jgi:hypothetical protein